MGCGNRPSYEKRKSEKENDEEQMDEVLVEETDGNNVRSFLCTSCGLHNTTEDVLEETFLTNECNVSRNARFLNGKIRSYGVIYTMYNCGIIVDYMEINLSEQVQVTLLHWTSMLRKVDNLALLPKIFVYDNACSVWIYFKKRFHESKSIKVTNASRFIDESEMFIDRLHQKTHTRPMCRKERNIKTRSDLTDVNTIVCEQTNAWLKQYINILCNLSGQRSKFYYLFLFHHLNCRRSSFAPIFKQ